jgi:hypothetical protein
MFNKDIFFKSCNQKRQPGKTSRGWRIIRFWQLSAGRAPAACSIEKSRGVKKEIATGHEHPWPIVNQRASCKFSEAHKDLIIHETKL